MDNTTLRYSILCKVVLSIGTTIHNLRRDCIQCFLPNNMELTQTKYYVQRVIFKVSQSVEKVCSKLSYLVK